VAVPAYEDGFDPPAPVARVDVIGPSGRQTNVPMLIDSGSDGSIVPRRVADAVGAAVRPSPYRLELFDGSIVPVDEADVTVRLSPYRFAGA
jgi:hypothetical protein